MSKELEALNKIQHDFGQLKGQELVNCYETIFNGLKRLEAIDNSKPSEAIKKLDDISYLVLNEIDDLKNKELWKSYFNTIKQALLKAQEQEKALKIIKENQVSTFWINECKSVEEYNGVYGRKLTQEEFDLLKRWLG